MKRGACYRYYEDQDLLTLISQIFWDSEGRYGSPRVHESLKKQGVFVGRKRVERLMKQAGLRGRVVRVTRRQPGLKRFRSKGQNLLLDMAKPTAINQVWVADVTYLKVNGQWQYLSTIMDQYSRRILGWSLSATRTTELTKATLDYALKKRGFPTDVIFHTDRGVEFAAHDFQEVLCRHQFKHSVNRPGHCTDNAYMESFYHSLKAELIRETTFGCVKELRKGIGRYVNGFYNSLRLHSGLNYMSPIEFEAMAA